MGASLQEDDRFKEPPLFFLLSPAELLKGDHTNVAWRAQVGRAENPSAALPMVVKYLKGGQIPLCIELACALSAQVLKLPIPQPALVIAERDQLFGLPAHVTGSSFLLIGSHYKKPDVLMAQMVNDNPAAEEFIWSRVCDSETGPKGAAWDELVVNADRHSENLLFDGSQWWLFDHDLALPKTPDYLRKGATREQRSMALTFQAQCNQLATQMVQRQPSSHGLAELARDLTKFRRELHALSGYAAKWRSDDLTLDGIFGVTAILIDKIALRLPALAEYISRRLANPDPPSLWTSHSQS